MDVKVSYQYYWGRGLLGWPEVIWPSNIQSIGWNLCVRLFDRVSKNTKIGPNWNFQNVQKWNFTDPQMQENLPKKAEEHPKTASYDFFETCSKITSFSPKMLLDYLYRDILFTLTSVQAQCAPIASKSRHLNSPLFGPHIHKGPTVVENTISLVFTENWKHFSTVCIKWYKYENWPGAGPARPVHGGVSQRADDQEEVCPTLKTGISENILTRMKRIECKIWETTTPFRYCYMVLVWSDEFCMQQFCSVMVLTMRLRILLIYT